MVCLLTHKRQFGPDAQKSNYETEQETCVLKIAQQQGLIDQLEGETETPGPSDWFYEFKFQFYDKDSNPVEESVRTVRATATEVLFMMNLVNYSIPALMGWHAMMNPNVVSHATQGPPVNFQF